MVLRMRFSMLMSSITSMNPLGWFWVVMRGTVVMLTDTDFRSARSRSVSTLMSDFPLERTLSRLLRIHSLRGPKISPAVQPCNCASVMPRMPVTARLTLVMV